MRRFYYVQAQVVYEKDGWRGSVGVPTFVLDANVQGILCIAHAEKVARQIVDPLGVAETVFLSVVEAEEDP
jgi:hypothetical protein